MWFVPAVMLFGCTYFYCVVYFWPRTCPDLWFGLNAVAVLIIACPCAMGFSHTLTSILVGTGRGAEMGVLFRKGEALQLLQDVKVVAVDKTGTLTEGKPTLTDFHVQSGFDADQVFALLASVEAKSEHPIALAIVQAATEKQVSLLPVTEFDSITGSGIEALVNGQRIQIGADRYMQQIGLDVSAFNAEAARFLGQEGKTPIYMAIDQQLAAIVAVADPIKDTTFAAIAALHQLGLKVAMITGDNRHTAQAIAARLQIDHVVAEVLPEGKVDVVRELQQQFGRVAFVGDGINDAPAFGTSRCWNCDWYRYRCCD